jgi:pilus assembly protein Flp/PilA
MLKKMKNLVVQEEGQALTEYGLIIGLIVVGCIVSLKVIGPKIAGYLKTVADAL